MVEKDDGNQGADGRYEMLWDCEYCGTKKLLGLTHRFCPHCGVAQGDVTRYFPEVGEEVAVTDHAYVGVDQICSACDSSNAAATDFCTQCGASLDSAKAASLQTDEPPAPVVSPTAKQPSKKKKLGALGIGGVLSAGAVTYFTWTQEIPVTLDAHSWSRQVVIEDFRPRSDQSWCDAMPRDAYSVSRTSEVRSHKQVPDGQSCTTRRVDKGDGTYQNVKECRTKYRQVPIYDDHCRFTVDRWAYGRTMKANGQGKQPHWPKVQLSCQAQRIGCEREKRREATYRVRLINKDTAKQYRCEVPESLWRGSKVNTQWQMEIRQVGGGAICSSLKASTAAAN